MTSGDLFDLSGKVAVITGGAGGIGVVYADALCEAGASVVIADLDADAAKGFVLALGLIVSIGERLPIRLGRLPGDIVIRGKHSVFYFPIVTSLLISVILSVVLWLFGRR